MLSSPSSWRSSWRTETPREELRVPAEIRWGLSRFLFCIRELPIFRRTARRRDWSAVAASASPATGFRLCFVSTDLTGTAATAEPRVVSGAPVTVRLPRLFRQSLGCFPLHRFFLLSSWPSCDHDGWLGARHGARWAIPRRSRVDHTRRTRRPHLWTTRQLEGSRAHTTGR